MSGVRKEETYRSSDPVYGQTGHHQTAIGAKGEELLHDVKSAIPGTKEHQATHPQGTGMTGSHYSQHTTTTGPHTGTLHTATNPVTGETTTHSTQTGAKVDQMWKDTKQAIPGTKEHKATHPTTGYTEDPMMKKY